MWDSYSTINIFIIKIKNRVRSYEAYASGIEGVIVLDYTDILFPFHLRCYAFLFGMSHERWYISLAKECTSKHHNHTNDYLYNIF